MTTATPQAEQQRFAAGLAASHRSGIASFIVMDVMRAAAAREAAGHKVIHMEVGQPATAAPRAAREAVKRALDTDTLGYTLALGMPALRERISQLYHDWYGITLSPNRVVVTSGSSAAFVLSFLAAFDVGAKVALPNPGYPCYRHILTALGQVPVILDTGPATRWMPTPEQVDTSAAQHGLSGLLIASPANPTGTMLTPDRLGAIIDVCRRRKLWFISDEIYHGLTYGDETNGNGGGIPDTTALAYSDDVIVINSFSKYFSMTGWRVGWMIVPERLVEPVERLAQNFYISPPAIAQVAALGAFDGVDELDANKRVYRANRDLLLAELPKAGFDRLVPADGAFYLYADVSRFTSGGRGGGMGASMGASLGDSLAFARLMLDETGVAATPGVDFDEARGRHYLRFSYSRSTADMAEGVSRLQSWARLKR